MRLRHKRRIYKLIARLGPWREPLESAIKQHRSSSLEASLLAILHDRSLGQHLRGQAARLLRSAGIDSFTPLLRIFFHETEYKELYETALAIEETRDRRFIPHLAHALLHDENPHRRTAAARALGSIWPTRIPQAARALAQCLADPAQPHAAREESAESLAYVGRHASLPALIAALHDPDVRIRFWSAFGLGGAHRGEPEAIAALESVLDDEAVTPGNWWSVGKEALAMLARDEYPIPAYQARLREETTRILSDPNASPEDHRWAEGYGSAEAVAKATALP